MSTFTQLLTISGEEINIRPNYKAKTFTIKSNGSTYRTFSMNAQEFEEAEYNTGNDWMSFLRSGSYTKVK
jgi:hypothetical protein